MDVTAEYKTHEDVANVQPQAGINNINCIGVINAIPNNTSIEPPSDLVMVNNETTDNTEIDAVSEIEENPESLAQKYSGKLLKTYNSFVNNFFLFQAEMRNNHVLVQKFNDLENSFIEKEVKEFEGVVLQSLKIDVNQMLQSYISKRYGSTSKELIETITKMNDDFIKQHEIFALKIASKMAEYAKMSIEKEYKHPAQQRVIESMIIHLEKLLANFELLQRKTLKNMTTTFGDINLKKQDE